MGVRLRYGVVVVIAAAAMGQRAAGHVVYVTENDQHTAPLPFLVDVLSDPVNVAILGGSAAGVIGVLIGYLHVRPMARDIAVFREAMRDYDDLIPWLLRLSFGIPLVGAGFVGYLFSPVVPPVLPIVAVPSRLFQIGVGFLLLFGFATRAVAAVGLAAFLVSVGIIPEVFLANEFIPGLLAIVIVGSGRPSADHVLHTIASAEGTMYGEIDPIHVLASRFNTRVIPYQQYVATIVRIGLGLNFIFLGVTQKLLAPGQALAVVDKYDLTGVVPVDPGLWVVGAGLAEATLGVALLLGVFTRASGMVALGLFTLTLFALPDDPVLAHLTLFGLASVLLITGSGPVAIDSYLE